MAEGDRLRVLLVSSSSGSEGGGELYLLRLAAGLKSLGHHVEAFLSTHPRMDRLAELLQPCAKIHREEYTNTYDRPLRAFGAIMDPALVRRMCDRFRAIDPDLIHVNKQNLEDGLDLLKAAAKTGLPFLSTIHITRSPVSLGARGGTLRCWIARSVLRHTASPCLAIARVCRDELAGLLGNSASGGPVHCVLNGVGDAPPADRGAIRRQWGCDDGEIVLGCLARLEAQKNPLFLLDLLPELPKHVRLVWVGDGRLRNELLERGKRLGVSERVHIDGWRSDGRQRLAAFDVFVLPSRYEGLPFSLLEAMAAGLPCVASDVDGSRETVVHGQSGLLCPPDDRRAWLACLRTLVESQPQRRRLGSAARKRYLAHFSLEAMARGTVDVYRNVIARASGMNGNSSR
jgi:glycosyltransferase involved in cell wall biosynthesis